MYGLNCLLECIYNAPMVPASPRLGRQEHKRKHNISAAMLERESM